MNNLQEKKSDKYLETENISPQQNSSKMTIDEETFEALRQIHSQLKLDEEVGWAGAGRY